MKVQRISEYQYKLRFPNMEESGITYHEAFLRSDLGHIYRSIPWHELCSELGLRDKGKGPKSIFSPRGKLALMFLKHYACCSDARLLEQLNGNIDYQYFCDLYIPPNARLENYKIISEIRCEIALSLDIGNAQSILARHWLPFMGDVSEMTCDATCYESSIRYPTDVKLLWEGVDWLWRQIVSLCAQAGRRRPRTKLKKWTARYVSYSKMKRKTLSKRRSLTRGLLRLLDKLQQEVAELEKLDAPLDFVRGHAQRRETIGKMYVQQYLKFFEGKPIKDRIVSIDKPYLRPIVRGKEVKKVEFGAKVHKLQIGGISFIEHLSFDAFNEGTRLMATIAEAQRLGRARIRTVGADAIYATNSNRKKITKKGIRTDFKPKGRKPKDADQRTRIAKMITKERASRMEGSFGTDKEHFLLKRILARTEHTEKLWIFFGIHTSNALIIGRKMKGKIKKAA